MIWKLKVAQGLVSRRGKEVGGDCFVVFTSVY
jgi:hypothetical protein